MPLHADQVQLDREIAAAHRSAGEVGLITDAGIAPLTTVAGLEALAAAAAVHADYEPVKPRYQRAIDVQEDLGTLTNTTVAAADTVEGLADTGEFGDDDTRKVHFQE